MNVDVFLIIIFSLVLVAIIVTTFLCITERISERTKAYMILPMLILLALLSLIIFSFPIISVAQLYKDKNTNTYNIAIVQVQETDKQDWNGKVIKYTDTTGKENEITISDTKCDADKTYIEIKRYKWWFLYEDENVLHIAISQE